MIGRAPVGWVTLVIGVALAVTSYRERVDVPPWVPRVAIAIVALGLSTIFAAQGTVPWSIASSACSVVAIVLLLQVIIRTFRRKR